MKLEREMFQRWATGTGWSPYVCAYGINLFPGSKMPDYFEISTINFESFNVSLSKGRVEGEYELIAEAISWESVSKLIDSYRVKPPAKRSFFDWLFGR